MSLRPRRVQNIPKKETKDIRASELNELKRENQKLRRECSKLRREVEKALSFVGEKEEEIEPAPEIILDENRCMNCGSTNLVQFNKFLIICRKCKYKKITK